MHSLDNKRSNHFVKVSSAMHIFLANGEDSRTPDSSQGIIKSREGESENLASDDSLKSFAPLIGGYDFSSRRKLIKRESNDENDENAHHNKSTTCTLFQSSSSKASLEQRQSFRQRFSSQIMNTESRDTILEMRLSKNKLNILSELPNPNCILKRRRFSTDLPLVDLRGKRSRNAFSEHLREAQRRCALASHQPYGSFTPAGNIISNIYPLVQQENLNAIGSEQRGPISRLLDEAMRSTATATPTAFNNIFVNPRFSNVIQYNPGSGQLNVLPAFSRLINQDTEQRNLQEAVRSRELDALLRSDSSDNAPHFKQPISRNVLTENLSNVITQPFKPSNVQSLFPSPAFDRAEPSTSRMGCDFELTGESFNVFGAPQTVKTPSNKPYNDQISGASWKPKFPKLWYI